MKRLVLSMVIASVAMTISSKSWWIGPSSVSGMDFANINAAMSSSSVVKGDTLFLNQFYSESSEQTVTKQVVIIGTGYDTSLTDEQVVAYIYQLDLKCDGVIVKSTKLSGVYFYNAECVLDRCYIGSNITYGSSSAGMNHVYSSYIKGRLSGYGSSNKSKIDVQNCVVVSSTNVCFEYFTASIFNNNTCVMNYSGSDYMFDSVINSQITNNILLRTPSSYYNYVFSTTTGNAIEHNILSSTSSLSGFPNNKYGYGGAESSLFECSGTFSDYYKLSSNSVAKGYATDGGECGCHGGMFGCPSGGRPQYVPYFSKVVVGSRTENGKLPVKLTVKIQEQ